MNFIFSWQKNYFTHSLRSFVKIVLPLENKIHIFVPPCNILYIIRGSKCHLRVSVCLTTFFKELCDLPTDMVGPRSCYTGEILKRRFLSDVPSTLIRHENRAFRKRSLNRRNLKSWLFVSVWSGKGLKMKLFENHHHHHIIIITIIIITIIITIIVIIIITIIIITIIIITIIIITIIITIISSSSPSSSPSLSSSSSSSSSSLSSSSPSSSSLSSHLFSNAGYNWLPEADVDLQ